MKTRNSIFNVLSVKAITIYIVLCLAVIMLSCEKEEELLPQETEKQLSENEQVENSKLKSIVSAYTYLPTLKFDGKDWWDTGETTFPMSFRFNTNQDANGDGSINVEDNLENSIRYKIGSSLYGTGRTGLSNRGPNNQKPAVYFHVATQGVYTVYQYWYYYADNDWVNDHEHDWEKVFVYVQNGTPKYVLLSTHNDYDMKNWNEITKSGNHPVLGVNGGSHAFKTGSEDGVQITYYGKITKNNGRLDAGDGKTYAWTIYSNDSNVSGVTGYSQLPDYFYYGDPYYSFQSEWGDKRQAPWKRSEWNSPPAP